MQKRIGTANGCADCLKRKTVTTPNDLNKPQDSGNWTEEMTGTDKWMEKNRKEDIGMNKVAPLAQAAVLYIPGVSFINDCSIILSGEDMYGNQSGMTDIGASCVDIGFMILKCAFVNFSGLKYVKASSFGLSTYSVKKTYQLQYNKYNK